MTDAKRHPYTDLPPTAFWRSGVAEAGPVGMSGLWTSKWALPATTRFATFGSCFAQHISAALKARQIGWVDGEPGPVFLPEPLARAYNYGVFSARTGNIYTAAQLRLLLELAVEQDGAHLPEIWQDGGRFIDSLRPMIEPDGFASRQEALLSRRSMLRGLVRAVTQADVVVLTLGLTEGWENATTGQPYAACPGTLGGVFDPDMHVFVDYRMAQIRADLMASLDLLELIKPGIKLLLTVSPVPLTATASGQHVLLATTQSKAKLRAVAGEMALDEAAVDYFPSYEIITSPANRAQFFGPNLRSVTPDGVAHVMGHFFAGLQMESPPAVPDADEAAVRAADAAEDVICEEAMLAVFNNAP
jgi:hypothetical protein